MSIEFIEAGLQTTIQDVGLFGQMHNGIPHSGAMDPIAMKLANWLVSKELDSPVLEITLIGPTLKFNAAMTIAICGALFETNVNGHSVPNNQTIKIQANDVLEFGKLCNGARAYLAFSGQLKLNQIEKSYSTQLISGFGGLKGKAIKKGEHLSFLSQKKVQAKALPCQLQLTYSNHLQLRITSGMESEWFSNIETQKFLLQTYQVTSKSNRMGLQIESGPIQTKSEKNLISSGVNPGSIQIPPDGQPIITSVEGQTIGGYPRIANVISADLHLLGQLKTKDKISFQPITIDEAQEINITKTSLIEQLMVESC